MGRGSGSLGPGDEELLLDYGCEPYERVHVSASRPLPSQRQTLFLRLQRSRATLSMSAYVRLRGSKPS
jgi:hypothetical protein